MTDEKYINSLSKIVITLTGLVALIGFVLSYDVLQSVAMEGGKSWFISWLWPLIIDLPIMVFTLIALFSIALGYRPWLAHLLVLAATAITIYFNYDYALNNSQSWQVAVAAPIAYYVSFESLAWLIKAISQRSTAIKTVQDLLDQANLVDNEISKKRLMLDDLMAKYDDLQAKIEANGGKVSAIGQAIKDKRIELARLDKGQSSVYVPANLTIEQRQELVQRMDRDGLTNQAIADNLQVSLGTVKNDKTAGRVPVNGKS